MAACRPLYARSRGRAIRRCRWCVWSWPSPGIPPDPASRPGACSTRPSAHARGRGAGDGGPRHRPRLARRDADAALRSPGPRARAQPGDCRAARARAARATGRWSASPIPNDIRNTAFLVWEHADADDERFLYLPALGRVRRIAGAGEAGELRRQRPELRGHRRPRHRRLHLRVRRPRTRRGPRPTARRHRGWALESRAKDTDAEFPRSVSVVLKEQLRRRARRHLQPARRAREGLRRQAARARGRHLDARSTWWWPTSATRRAPS